MTKYCENCGEELGPEEENEGICKKCKSAKSAESEYKKDENFIDPGVT